MTNAGKILAKNRDFVMKINVSKVKDSDDYVAIFSASKFDPNNKISNGGPVTIKQIETSVIGNSFDEAYNKAETKVVEFLGFEEDN
jgi:hypothetical protein